MYLDHPNHAFRVDWEDLETVLRWTLKSPPLFGAYHAKQEYTQEVGASSTAIVR